jgi:hypothetical protein
LLAPTPTPGDVPDAVLLLESPTDPGEYAYVLYARLREADRHALDVLLAVPPGQIGIGEAITDRLRRAAGAPA